MTVHFVVEDMGIIDICDGISIGSVLGTSDPQEDLSRANDECTPIQIIYYSDARTTWISLVTRHMDIIALSGIIFLVSSTGIRAD